VLRLLASSQKRVRKTKCIQQSIGDLLSESDFVAKFKVFPLDVEGPVAFNEEGLVLDLFRF